MSGKVSQRDAVYNAIFAVLATHSITFEDGGDVSTVLTDDMRESVHQALMEGFKNRTITFEDTPANREKLASDSKLSAYVSGLISNWVRKDKRFNGGVAYRVQNPGSRTGQGDEQLKTLRALKKQFAGSDKEVAIDASITKRVAEIQAEKNKPAELTAEQIAMLDPELAATLGLSATA